MSRIRNSQLNKLLNKSTPPSSVKRILTFATPMGESMSFPSLLIQQVNPFFKSIAQSLELTIKHNKLANLSSPQIGDNFKLIALYQKAKRYNVEDFTERPLIMFNPRIEEKSNEVVDSIEQSISVPFITSKVSRHQKIVLSYTNEDQEDFTKEFTNFQSILIQQSLDYLSNKNILYPSVNKGNFEIKAGIREKCPKLCQVFDKIKETTQQRIQDKQTNLDFILDQEIRDQIRKYMIKEYVIHFMQDDHVSQQDILNLMKNTY